MTIVLTIINVVIALTVLTILIYASKGAETISQPQPRVGDNLSRLARRQEALQLATQKWHESVELGLTFAERHQREVVVRLEREVAELEDEMLSVAEEVTPKTETPKRQPVAKVEFVGDDFFPDCYIITCSFCGWSWWGRSEKRAEAKRAQHEREHL